MSNISLCFVAAPSQEVAAALAKLVVDRRLAACVSIVPGVQSVYRWKGEIALDEEVLMVIKTTTERVQNLREMILTEHPYEVPEFVALTPTAVSDAYARWVADSTTLES